MKQSRYLVGAHEERVPARAGSLEVGERALHEEGRLSLVSHSAVGQFECVSRLHEEGRLQRLEHEGLDLAHHLVGEPLQSC